jgi:ATP-binding protein involved in chromosome partitioning
VPLIASLPLSLSIREQTDAGRPTVIAEPDSEVTRIFLEAAEAVQQALAGRGDSVVRQFPEINITDD